MISQVDWPWAIRAFLAHFGLGVLLAWSIYLLSEKLLIPKSKRSGFKEATIVGFWGGMISNLVDLDHLVILFDVQYLRPWHIPLAVVALIHVLISIIAIIPPLVTVSSPRFRCRAVNVIQAHLKYTTWSICIIAHVLEDFIFGWF